MTVATKNKKGFTLIELVIVLAIAALILAAIFLAISGAQRSRRDSQRTGDLGKIVAEIETFAGNNNGCYPAAPAPCSATTFAQFWTQFQTAGQGQLLDPSSGAGYGTALTVPVAGNLAAGATAVVYYRQGEICATNSTTAAGTARQFAVFISLENGQSACRDNR